MTAFRASILSYQESIKFKHPIPKFELGLVKRCGDGGVIRIRPYAMQSECAKYSNHLFVFVMIEARNEDFYQLTLFSRHFDLLITVMASILFVDRIVMFL